MLFYWTIEFITIYFKKGENPKETKDFRKKIYMGMERMFLYSLNSMKHNNKIHN